MAPVTPKPAGTPSESIAVDLTLQHPRAALDAAIDAARLAAPFTAEHDGVTHILAPEGYGVHKIADPFALAPYIHALVTVDDRASLSAYVNRFSDNRSILIADYDARAITGALDWHGDNGEGELQVQPRKHAVTLKLRDSEEFARWNKVQGKMMGQAEFAAFLEENACDVIDPEPAVLIEISRDLEATQGVTFKSSTRLESGDRAFVYMNETQVKGQLRVPREFTLSIPLWNGEGTVEVRCALRFRVGDGGLALGFEWRRVEYQRQATFHAIATQACEETGCPVFFGRA